MIPGNSFPDGLSSLPSQMTPARLFWSWMRNKQRGDKWWSEMLTLTIIYNTKKNLGLQFFWGVGADKMIPASSIALLTSIFYRHFQQSWENSENLLATFLPLPLPNSYKEKVPLNTSSHHELPPVLAKPLCYYSGLWDPLWQNHNHPDHQTQKPFLNFNLPG